MLMQTCRNHAKEQSGQLPMQLHEYGIDFFKDYKSPQQYFQVKYAEICIRFRKLLKQGILQRLRGNNFQ
jgi:hypothetical protein